MYYIYVQLGHLYIYINVKIYIRLNCAYYINMIYIYIYVCVCLSSGDRSDLRMNFSWNLSQSYNGMFLIVRELPTYCMYSEK